MDDIELNRDSCPLVMRKSMKMTMMMMMIRGGVGI